MNWKQKVEREVGRQEGRREEDEGECFQLCSSLADDSVTFRTRGLLINRGAMTFFATPISQYTISDRFSSCRRVFRIRRQKLQIGGIGGVIP